MSGTPQRHNAARPDKPCLAPPKRRPAAYHHRPRQAPDQAEPVRVILPDEPPRLPPAAARALLRILLKAHAELAQEGIQMTGKETQ
jgi:hypothetical protein